MYGIIISCHSSIRCCRTAAHASYYLHGNWEMFEYWISIAFSYCEGWMLNIKIHGPILLYWIMNPQIRNAYNEFASHKSTPRSRFYQTYGSMEPSYLHTMYYFIFMPLIMLMMTNEFRFCILPSSSLSLYLIGSRMKILFEIAVISGGWDWGQREEGKRGRGETCCDKFILCQASLTRQPESWRFHIYGWVLRADDNVCVYGWCWFIM